MNRICISPDSPHDKSALGVASDSAEDPLRSKVPSSAIIPFHVASVLEKNLFVESVLPRAILRKLSEEEIAAYRAPFVNAG